MKREDIEKAAKKELKGIVPCEWNQEPFIDIFVRGANYRINIAWHNADEMPKKKGYILVEVNGGQAIFVAWNINVIPTNWDKIVKENNVVKWAYIEDLMPDMEE